MMKLRLLNANSPNYDNRQIEIFPETTINNEYFIGRSPKCKIVLSDVKVSRIHGNITYQQGQYSYQDLASSTGSKVNNQDIQANQKYVLNPNDIISIGDYILIVEEILIGDSSSGEHLEIKSAPSISPPDMSPQEYLPVDMIPTEDEADDSRVNKFKLSTKKLTYSIHKFFLEKQELRGDLIDEIHLSDGQILFNQGDPGDAFYLVEKGQLKIFILDPEGKPMTLNILSPGDTVGELALLDAKSRSASAMAIGNCILIRLNQEQFLNQLMTSPTWMQYIIKLMSQRARHMTDYIIALGQWSRLIINGKYDEVLEELEEVEIEGDKAIAAVADSLKQMVKAVREREENLRQEVTELKIQIQIDQEKREQSVKEITDTDRFEMLLKRAEKLRQSKKR